MLVILSIFFAGCSQTIVTRYQCADGSYVDSSILCPSIQNNSVPPVTKEDTSQLTTAPVQVKCVAKWSCSEWSECSASSIQKRTCNDINNCGLMDNKPSESQSCSYVAPVSWHKIVTFSGNGLKNTETFTIPSNEWRISWDTQEGQYGAMNFQIYIYKNDGSLVGIAANVIGSNTDSTMERGSGDYYFTINTAQPYKIIVEAKY